MTEDTIQELKLAYQRELSLYFQELSLLSYNYDYLTEIISSWMKLEKKEPEYIIKWITKEYTNHFEKVIETRAFYTIKDAVTAIKNIDVLFCELYSHFQWLEIMFKIPEFSLSLKSNISSKYQQLIRNNKKTIYESLSKDIYLYLLNNSSIKYPELSTLIINCLHFKIVTKDVIINMLNESFQGKELSTPNRIGEMWSKLFDLHHCLFESHRLSTMNDIFKNYEALFNRYFTALRNSSLSQYDIGTLLFSGMDLNDPLLPLFVQSRNIIPSREFSALMHSIFLIEPYPIITSIDDKQVASISETNIGISNHILKSIRTNYQGLILDPHSEVFVKLDTFLNMVYKKNYTEMYCRKPINTSHFTEICRSIVTFIVHYLPNPAIFFKNYYIPSLFRRVLMQQNEFTAGICDENCMELKILLILKRYYSERSDLELSSRIQFIISFIDISEKSISDYSVSQGTKINKLILKDADFRESSIHNVSKSICLPNKTIRSEWDSLEKSYWKQGKVLFNAPHYHLFEVTCPIILPNKQHLTLILNTTMASIIYLFNDCEQLTKDEIVIKLQLNDQLDQILNDIEMNLTRLNEKKILNLVNNKYFFNTNFEPNQKVLSTGTLKCF